MSAQLPSLSKIASEYDQRFAQGDLQESGGFYRWVLKCLSPTFRTTLLDVSCGEGVWGVDISTTALKRSRQNAPDAKLARCDGITLPFPDNTFHYITNLGSLEHYTSILQGVQEMARVLRPEGSIAILVPNSYYLADIIWQVWRTGYGPSHRQVLERFATVGEWKDILEEGRIEVLSTYAYNFRFPVRLADWQWYRKRPRKFLNLLIAPFTPLNLSYCFLFIGQKRQDGGTST
jgi:SAM-dependent methyltransferase